MRPRRSRRAVIQHANAACSAALFVRADWVSKRPSELYPRSALIPEAFDSLIPRSVRFRRRRAEPDAMKGTSMTTATESEETVSLIASDKVEGTAVYGTDDKKIGKLERVMIDKISGKVAYAV